MIIYKTRRLEIDGKKLLIIQKDHKINIKEMFKNSMGKIL